MPRHDHRKEPSTDETFPSFVRRKRDKWTMDELSTTTHTTYVGHDIICKHQTARKYKPYQSIEYIVHNVL